MDIEAKYYIGADAHKALYDMFFGSVDGHANQYVIVKKPASSGVAASYVIIHGNISSDSFGGGAADDLESFTMSINSTGRPIRIAE